MMNQFRGFKFFEGNDLEFTKNKFFSLRIIYNGEKFEA